MSLFYTLIIQRIRSVSIEVWQIRYIFFNTFKTCNSWYWTDVYGSSLVWIHFMHFLSITCPFCFLIYSGLKTSIHIKQTPCHMLPDWQNGWNLNKVSWNLLMTGCFFTRLTFTISDPRLLTFHAWTAMDKNFVVCFHPSCFTTLVRCGRGFSCNSVNDSLDGNN